MFYWGAISFTLITCVVASTATYITQTRLNDIAVESAPIFFQQKPESSIKSGTRSDFVGPDDNLIRRKGNEYFWGFKGNCLFGLSYTTVHLIVLHFFSKFRWSSEAHAISNWSSSCSRRDISGSKDTYCAAYKPIEFSDSNIIWVSK